MEDKVFLDESGLGEVGKVIKEHYASKEDLSKIDVTEQLVDYVKKTEVPTKLSQFVNDKSFKTEDEIKKLINESNKLKKEIVTSLPSSGVEDVVYLLKNKSDSNNVCTEYLWINGQWEIIGDTKVDFADYAKKSDLDNKVDKVDGKSLSSHDFTDEKLQSFNKMELEQERLDFVNSFMNDSACHEIAIISGNYGFVEVDNFISFEDDYSNIYAPKNSEHILAKIKNRTMLIPKFMRLTVQKTLLEDKNNNVSCYIVQKLYDPFTGITFETQTKTRKKEYTDEEILKKVSMDVMYDVRNIVPEDDWYPWGLRDNYNFNASAVQAGKLADGDLCGLMTPDDKRKLDNINIDQLSKATQAEAETGTDDTKYMTPLATKQAIDKLAQSGGGIDKQYLYDILFGESLVTRKAGEWAVVHGKPTTIERQAFEGEKLVSVTIPDSVTNIEYHAFASNRLTNVIIPNSVTNIENGAFCDNRLTSIIIPDSITTIDINMFEGNRLTSVSIPDSVVRIGHAAFANNRLTNVTIPDSVTTIENFTFANNYLTSVVIPDSIATIEDYAFNKNKLVNVIIPNSVTSIGKCAFSINKLKEVKIPKNCQVAKNAFDDGVNIIRY